MDPVLACHNISKSFRLNGRPIPVLEGVSLTVEPGQAVGLVGPSGCGKSTLLALLAGFYPPETGTIRKQGRLSLMLQRDLLLPHRTVTDNAALPAEVRCPARLAQTRRQVRELLPRFGLEGFGDSYPQQLSGGMRQRAALLRTVIDSRLDSAVAAKPAPTQNSCWLLDEPFGKLDALTKEDLQLWLDGLRREYRAALLLVTHDISEALLLCDRIYVLTSRPGRIAGTLLTEAGREQEQKQEIRKLLGDSLSLKEKPPFA